MDFLNQIFCSVFILHFSLSSLSGQEIIFPGLRGDSLTTMLVRYYTPTTVLPYDQARTKLYSIIDNHQDSVECFYSGYKIPIPQNTNVLSWTARYGIQTEHLFPRSKGAASLPALGDLHHLVPAKSTINTLRNNSPFLEIPDNNTTYWILNDKILLIKPNTKLLDQYSESKKAAFEPKEAVKGDVARSIFYFYTIYKSAADKKSKTFFTSMLPDLCAWSKLDKVDSLEYNRTIAIARFQGNINPFVIDPSLAERCYCSTYLNPSKPYAVNIYPNPSKGLFYINIPDYQGQFVMKIYADTGKLISTDYLIFSGLMSWRLGEGLYKVNITLDSYQELEAIVLIR